MFIFIDSVSRSFITLAIVVFFLSLRRGTRNPRYQLWIAGWSVILLNYILELLTFHNLTLQSALVGVQLSTSVLSGIIFVLSFSAFVRFDRYRWAGLVLVGVPAILYSFMIAFGLDNFWFYIPLLVAAYATPIGIMIRWHRKASLFVVMISGFLLACFVYSALGCISGNPMNGFHLSLWVIFALAGLVALRKYRRLSPGVVGTVLGFATWAIASAVAVFDDAFSQQIGWNSEIWLVPKIIVALGMIVTELEDRNLEAESAEGHARQLTAQIVRFADLTSRLLGGSAVRPLCPEIAHTIVEVGNFNRAAIILRDLQGEFEMVGHAGIEDEDLAEVQNLLCTRNVIESVCEHGRRVGANSFTHSFFQKVSPLWSADIEITIPLRSTQGDYFGRVVLSAPKNLDQLVAEELAGVEMLASDIAIAIEQSTMQRRAMMQERLASVGQLVGGVAHELNNPLTVILGYSELMTDTDTDGKFQREIASIRREAHRMRTIIGNLLRFARQSAVETKSASVNQTIDDAVSLREYDAERRGITLSRNVGESLPPVAFDEAQLKTVLINLISNSFDAMKDSDRKFLNISARMVGERVSILISDSGRGFSDADRAFDPFFSTKSVGAGAGLGLGLSVCYGIVKQHGGEIYAQNLDPVGACVTLELLVASEPLSNAVPVVAH